MAVDFGLILDLLESDPCAAHRQLRIVQLNLATSGGVQKVVFRDRETWFQPADRSALDELVAEAANACAAASGQNRQFAITLGGGRRRRRCP